jgi:hypothetical protein
MGTAVDLWRSRTQAGDASVFPRRRERRPSGGRGRHDACGHRRTEPWHRVRGKSGPRAGTARPLRGLDVPGDPVSAPRATRCRPGARMQRADHVRRRRAGPCLDAVRWGDSSLERPPGGPGGGRDRADPRRAARSPNRGIHSRGCCSPAQALSRCSPRVRLSGDVRSSPHRQSGTTRWRMSQPSFIPDRDAIATPNTRRRHGSRRNPHLCSRPEPRADRSNRDHLDRDGVVGDRASSDLTRRPT